MAAPECEREARKRRERRDSGCTHERKERRPHSEERPPPPPPPPPLHDHNRLETERRAERLSRARRPQYGAKRRRAARIPKHPKENECFTTTGDIRSSTPPNFDYAVIPKPQISDEPETLDAGALHRQAGRENSDEGSASVGESAAERVRQHERSVVLPHARRDQPSPDRRLEKISKKIIVLKKNIAKYESEYELKNGHSMTQGDRITDVQLTRMYEALRRLQAEKRCIKADPVEYALKMQALKQQKERDDKLDAALKSDKPMMEVVRDIEEWLEGCRQASGRASVPEGNWTSAQLATEKSCVQRALLRLEAARGRPPAHSADRGAARHLYERYRTVKRVLACSRPDAIIGCNGELATIHEHEAMLFNTSVDSSSESQEKPSDASKEGTDTLLQSPPTSRDNTLVAVEELPSSASSVQSITSDEAAPSNEGLHFLGLDDLIRALAEAKLQKSVLRHSIKEYEVSFEMQYSRKVQHDDKKGREEEYLKYKNVKARIKLLNALINKQKALHKYSL